MQISSAFEKLPFELPPFKRIAWVSTKAQITWEPIIQSLAEKNLDIRLQMLLNGSYSCIVQQFAAWEYLKAINTVKSLHLHCDILETYNAFNPQKENDGFVKPIFFKVVIGSQQHVDLFKKSWELHDHYTMAQLLGIPACCNEFYINNRIKKGWKDLTWLQALNTPFYSKEELNIDFLSFPLLNVLWRTLGIDSIGYSPCSFACSHSGNVHSAFLYAGRSLGLKQEMDWMETILSWPVEWTALHGIAEIKTPVLRVSTNTDATSHKLCVRLHSDVYPKEGSTGIHFPFRRLPFARITDSKAFYNGLKNEISIHT